MADQTPAEMAEQIKKLAHGTYVREEQLAWLDLQALLPLVDSLAKRLTEAEAKVAQPARDRAELAATVVSQREALRTARWRIGIDRECLFYSHVSQVSGKVEDALGREGLDEYDAVLAAIDAALSGEEGSKT